MAGDHPIRGRAVGIAFAATNRLLMSEQPQLDERALVEQQADPLTDGQLSPLMLLVDLLGTTHRQVLLAPGV